MGSPTPVKVRASNAETDTTAQLVCALWIASARGQEIVGKSVLRDTFLDQTCTSRCGSGNETGLRTNCWSALNSALAAAIAAANVSTAAAVKPGVLANDRRAIRASDIMAWGKP